MIPKIIEILSDNNIQQVRAQITEALELVGNMCGMTFRLGNIKYSPSGMRCTLNGVVLNTGVSSIEENDFKNHAHRFGIDPSCLFKSFVNDGKRYKIIGLNSRSRKSHLVATCSDGKRYRIPDEWGKLAT